jgi:receptor protein-tyrosine kinase
MDLAVPLLDKILAELGDSLKDLARCIRRVGPVQGGTTVLLTGCRRSVGCSTMAAALAAAAAQDRSVLLIDADLSQPSLANLLGVQATFGWDDYVEKRCFFEEALHDLSGSQAPDFMALAHPADPQTRLLSRPELPSWLAQCRQDYGLIILDGGSIQEAAARWTPWADVALVVCPSSQTLAEDWAVTWDRLEEGGTHVLGIVETMT